MVKLRHNIQLSYSLSQIIPLYIKKRSGSNKVHSQTEEDSRIEPSKDNDEISGGTALEISLRYLF